MYIIKLKTERTNNFMCISFVYFYKVNGHKVKIIKWNEVMQKYLVEFNTGIRQHVLEILLKATSEKVESDEGWGKRNG